VQEQEIQQLPSAAATWNIRRMCTNHYWWLWATTSEPHHLAERTTPRRQNSQ